MRILFTFAGGNGHFEPLVPIAHAAQLAGHTVAVAGQPAMRSIVRGAGFTAFGTGPDPGGTDRLPLLELCAEREERAVRDGFARRAARRRASDLLALCAEWQPDLIVCDEMDFGSVIAAERLGLPHATVLVIAAGSLVRPELVAEPLNELRAEHGLPPDPEFAMMHRYLVLSPFPPSFRDPAFPLPATAHSFRPLIPDLPAKATASPWCTDMPEAPTVYFTLGTEFNMESGDLFARVLAGLRDVPINVPVNVPINVVVTVGRHIDPADFGPQPTNVHVERYIPQSLVLPPPVGGPAAL